MIETRQCLSGHPAPEHEFGVDRSKPDGLNPYCKNCVINRVHKFRERAKQNGYDALGRPLLLGASERAIERNRQKRRVEKEIELSLQDNKVSESDFDHFESPWAGLIPFVRPGRVTQRAWEIR